MVCIIKSECSPHVIGPKNVLQCMHVQETSLRSHNWGFDQGMMQK